MKRLQQIQTYIDLAPKLEEQELARHGFEPAIELPGFELRRDAVLDKKHQTARILMFAGKMAVKSLKMAGRGIEYTLTELIEIAEHDRAYRLAAEKRGLKVGHDIRGKFMYKA